MQDFSGWAGVAVALATLAWTVWYTRRKADAAELRNIYDRIERAERDKAGEKWVGELEKRVDKVEDRATKVEGRLDQLPDVAVTHRLEVSIIELKAEVSVIAERLKPVAETSRRMQEMMLEREARP